MQVLESLQLESFNESLNARSIYTQASNYLSERDDDYEKAKTKGFGLLCKLRSPDLSFQSPYTWDDLLESGWVRTPVPEDDADKNTMFTDLEPVFRYLEIAYRQVDSKGVQWSNEYPSENAQGEDVEVCVRKLY
jgi:hypothetical protein